MTEKLVTAITALDFDSDAYPLTPDGMIDVLQVIARLQDYGHSPHEFLILYLHWTLELWDFNAAQI